MSESKVIIGLPVYNGEKYIGAAIESHLSQSFGDFDLVISDNASTDATPEICAGYAAKDKRIKYLRSAENRGNLWNHRRVLDAIESPNQYFRWAGGDDISDALRDATPLPNSRLEALRTFTLSVVRNRGNVDEVAVQEFLDAGFNQRQILEVILGISHKVMSNYTNHFAKTPVDAAFTKFAWSPSLAPLRKRPRGGRRSKGKQNEQSF